MRDRLNSIDAIRGICLVSIFTAHLGLHDLPSLTIAGIGFIDSADIFVLLSGISVFFAYGSLATERKSDQLVAVLWHRALKLYLVYVALLVATISVSAGFATAFGSQALHAELLRGEVLEVGGFDGLTLRTVWSLVTFEHRIGYSAILRLYTGLMLLAPPLVWLAARRWWLPLLPATCVWLVAGHLGLIVSCRLSGEPLTLPILPWLVVFVLGLSLGAAIRQGVRLPASRLAVGLALLYLTGVLLLSVVLVRFVPEVAAWTDRRHDLFWLGASKLYQSPLRIAQLVALAYLVLALPQAPLLRLIRTARPDSLFCRLGRRSLPVFAAGIVCALFGNEVLHLLRPEGGTATGLRLVAEAALLGLGLLAMLAAAEGVRPRRLATPWPAEHPIPSAGS
ncbi:OpgC domain-containing protein [Methylobacterium durans]|uniref:OpgC domain-containing protein n=1 Tax=Methylobacterium durans TaxID=2202825 RepID=A0A2U8W4C9_9HYPH|nr:OpgC domain-containing protein [Methylobacterium durans]AWN40965.1 hypothetical protein DK389_11070 [Methylobacterium durans]